MRDLVDLIAESLEPRTLMEWLDDMADEDEAQEDEDE